MATSTRPPVNQRARRPGARRPLGTPRPASLWYGLGVLLLLGIAQAYVFVPSGRAIPYSEFKQRLREGQVAEVTVGEQTVRGKFKPDKNNRNELFSTTRIEDPNLVEDLDKQQVKYTGEVVSRWLPELISWMLPLLLLIGVWSFFFRRMGGAEGGVMSFARSRAKIYAEDDVKVKFADVAGVDEADRKSVV